MKITVANVKGRILLADDEPIFRTGTCKLLQREGYLCDCASDSDTAARLLRDQEYDLLISDIRMPGNENLEFVRSLSEREPRLPVILVTASPNTQTAIQSLRLSVVAYLVKPIEIKELLSEVRKAVDQHNTTRAIKASRKRAQLAADELGRMEECLAERPRACFEESVSTFLTLTLNNLVTAAADLKFVTELVTQQAGDASVQKLLQHSRPQALLEALRDTISVLEKTKSAAKPKELAQLRTRLQQMAADATPAAKN